MNNTDHRANRTALAAVLACVFALAGCSNKPIPGVYRIDIQQGNVITQDMLDKLEPGMDRRKVLFVLGTPLLADPFNQDRWDYMYSIREGRRARYQRRISVYFEEDLLVRVEGDIQAGSSERKVVDRPETVVSVPDRDDGGFLKAITPGFLKRESKRSIDPAATEQATADARKKAATPAPAEAPALASAAPAEAVPDSGVTPQSATEESRYFRRLFTGYGEDRPTAPLEPAAPEPTPSAVATTSEPPAEAAPPGQAAAPGPAPAAGPPQTSPATAAATEPVTPPATESATAEAPEERDDAQGGFFSSLVKRLRESREGEPGTGEGGEPPPDGAQPGAETPDADPRSQ